MTRFIVVPGSSSIDTEVESSIHPIHGRATDLSGVVEGEFDGEGRLRFDQPHGGWVEVPVEAIRSGNRLTELEMQRRAEAGRFPMIRFEVNRAWAVNGTDRYRAAVSVTAHGRTQAFEEDFHYRRDGARLVLNGQHTFDMRDFGVNPPRIFTLRVEPRVRVSVRLVTEQEE
ncbi:MAG TPA: YceI family protein [Terriglobales bacterium]|nr:YceI family protein [Terriglobales bacterium]